MQKEPKGKDQKARAKGGHTKGEMIEKERKPEAVGPSVSHPKGPDWYAEDHTT
jgi:hypothetical protein